MINLRCVSYYLITFCLSISFSSKAQRTILAINSIDTSNRFIIDTLHVKTQFSTYLQANQYVKQLSAQLQSQGYLAASLDSIRETKDTIFIILFVGKKYSWNTLVVSTKDKQLLHQLGIREEFYQKKAITIESINGLNTKLLTYFSNNGYPFSHILLDSIYLHETSLNAKLKIDSGINYRLDSLRILGTAKINPVFLYRYLNIMPGDLFSIDKLNKINQLLQMLPFLQQTKDWDITMLAGSYLLNLYLEPKKSNQINVLAGFLPANTQTGGKLLFTGEATVSLKNSFANGETIGVNWQQLQTSSPRLNLVYKQPFIFSSPYGIDFSFDLYKKDSAYLNLTTKIGLQYLATAKQSASISLQNFTTNVLDIDTAAVIATKKLPDIMDVRSTGFVIDYQLNNTNYHPNPLRGNDFAISVAVGNKQIKKNNAILQLKDQSFNYSKLYDSVKLNSYQVRLKTALAQYFSIGKQSVLKIAATAGWLESPNYFRNELFQIGGTKLLRGFNEESILANKFSVFTLEYRYLLGINSYFNGFTDIGLTQNSVQNSNNSFIGSGFGIAFETKQGILNISLAAGKQNDLPFNLKESKIHIGFVSIF